MTTWIKPRIWEVLIVVFLLSPIFALDLIVTWVDEMQDTQAYFKVNRVEVFDTVEGDDPDMIYDRTVLRPFTGTWRVRVIRQIDNFPMCNNSATLRYLPKVGPKPTAPVKLGAFFLENEDCARSLPPGEYRVFTRWAIQLTKRVTRYIEHETEPFHILKRPT